LILIHSGRTNRIKGIVIIAIAQVNIMSIIIDGIVLVITKFSTTMSKINLLKS